MTRNWREMACGRNCYGQYYNIFPFCRCLCTICICCICLAWVLEFLLRLRVRSDGQVRLVDAPELADHIDPPLDVISLISNFSSFLRVDFVRWNSCLCILCMSKNHKNHKCQTLKSHNGFLDARSLLAVSIAFTLICLRGASFQSCAEVPSESIIFWYFLRFLGFSYMFSFCLPLGSPVGCGVCCQKVFPVRFVLQLPSGLESFLKHWVFECVLKAFGDQWWTLQCPLGSRDTSQVYNN